MEKHGFLGSLFDYSFSSFVTSRIVKVLYVLTTIFVGLWTLLLIVFAFHVSSVVGALTLLLIGPFLFLVWMTYARVVLEVLIVLFRISENVSKIADADGRTQETSSPEPEPPATPAQPAPAA